MRILCSWIPFGARTHSQKNRLPAGRQGLGNPARAEVLEGGVWGAPKSVTDVVRPAAVDTTGAEILEGGV